MMFDQDAFELTMLQEIAAKCRVEPTVPAPSEPDQLEMEYGSSAWSLPGFGAGARVATSFGHVPVELLRRRDAIRTQDGRFLKVQFVDAVRLDRRYLLTHPQAQPVEIPQNGLALSTPNAPMFVSACQKIRPPLPMDTSVGHDAVDFIGRGRIIRKSHGYFTYYVFHCGEPCVANVNGVWVELDPSALEISLDELE